MVGLFKPLGRRVHDGDNRLRRHSRPNAIDTPPRPRRRCGDTPRSSRSFRCPLRHAIHGPANARVMGRCTTRHFFIRSKVVASQNSARFIVQSLFQVAGPLVGDERRQDQGSQQRRERHDLFAYQGSLHIGSLQSQVQVAPGHGYTQQTVAGSQLRIGVMPIPSPMNTTGSSWSRIAPRMIRPRCPVVIVQTHTLLLSPHTNGQFMLQASVVH